MALEKNMSTFLVFVICTVLCIW